MNAENKRLQESRETNTPWKNWGPYLTGRQWGTVREDYSEGGNAWDDFSHDQARSRAYHWGEDGLAEVSDHKQRLCFGLALWNGNDSILKERLFGLTSGEGNHGETDFDAFCQTVTQQQFGKAVSLVLQAIIDERVRRPDDPAFALDGPRRGRERIAVGLEGIRERTFIRLGRFVAGRLRAGTNPLRLVRPMERTETEFLTVRRRAGGHGKTDDNDQPHPKAAHDSYSFQDRELSRSHTKSRRFG